ncbi:MAG: hypothetical protein AB3N24_08080 [Leisingera sp.]
MLKLKADAQPADEPEKTRGTAVRIDGVSAPKNIKIGLVASTAEQGTDATPAAGKAAAVKNIKQTGPEKVARLSAAEAKSAPDPQPFAPVQPEGASALPKLGLAAAGLAVASAMLLYFQFGSDAPDETPAAGAELAGLAAAAKAEQALPAGAAAAAELEGAETSTEDALVARITAGTLAALRSKQADPAAETPAAPAAPAEGTALFKMVMTAAAQGQSEAYIDQLVNGAYERREITVPDSLIGAGGRVDTATLLALFVGN